MNLKAYWKVIVPIDLMLFAGFIVGFWVINKPLLLKTLPNDFDWLAICIANAVLMAGVIYLPLIQYFQLRVKINEDGISKRNLFGTAFYNWKDLKSVEMNQYAIDLYFPGKKIQLLPYLFENRLDLLEYLKNKATK